MSFLKWIDYHFKAKQFFKDRGSTTRINQLSIFNGKTTAAKTRIRPCSKVIIQDTLFIF